MTSAIDHKLINEVNDKIIDVSNNKIEKDNKGFYDEDEIHLNIDGMFPVSGYHQSIEENDKTVYPYRGEDKCKLFVGQIPKTWDSKAVFELFKDYGVQECSIITDRVTGRHCSCAFIRVSNELDGQRAIEHFHNKITISPMKNPLQVRVASHPVNRIRSNSNVSGNLGRSSDLASSSTISGGGHGLIHGFGSISSMSTNPQENKFGRVFNPEIHEESKIFVVNSSLLSEDELTQLFSQFGKIVSVLCLSKRFFPNSPQQGSINNNKYCSIISFEAHDEAAKAVNASLFCPKTNIPMVIKWSKKQFLRPSGQYHPSSYQEMSPSFDAFRAVQYQNVYSQSSSSSMPFLSLSQNGVSPIQPFYFVPVDSNMVGYQTGSPMMMMPMQQQSQSPNQQQNQQNMFMPGFIPHQMFMPAYTPAFASYIPTNQQYQELGTNQNSSDTGKSATTNLPNITNSNLEMNSQHQSPKAAGKAM